MNVFFLAAEFMPILAIIAFLLKFCLKTRNMII